MNSNKHALVIADDNVLLAEALATLLASTLGFTCVVSEGSLSSRLTDYEAQRCDLVVVLAGHSLVELPLKLPKLYVTGAKKAVLVPSEARLSMRQLSAMDADGVFAMGISAHEFQSGIVAIMQGKKFLSAGLLGSFRALDLDRQLAVLSTKELALLTLVARGDANQLIADKLHISTKTVYSYKARIYTKLGVDNDVQVLWLALRSGLLSE